MAAVLLRRRLCLSRALVPRSCAMRPHQLACSPRCRLSTASPTENSDDRTNAPPVPPADQPAWTRMMNDAIERFPMETMILYVASDISCIFFAYNLIDAIGYAGDADLALALALSRLLRRVRLPLDIGVAAVLAQLYPPLAQVNISRLFSRASPDASSAPMDAKQRFIVAAKRVADRYGLAFVASQRMVVGLTSTGAIYAALRSGVDVQGALAGYGFDLPAAVGEVAGRYAAAMCVGALAFPGVVLGTGLLAGRVVGPWRLAMAKRGKLPTQAPPPPPPSA